MKLKMAKPTLLLLVSLILLIVVGIFIAVFIAKRSARDHVPLPEVTKEKGPEIVEVFPEDGSEDIPVGSAIEIFFGAPINENSISYSITPTIELTKTVDEDLRAIFLSPLPFFEPGGQYTVTITKGSSTIKEQNFEGHYSFEFKAAEKITESDKTSLQADYDTGFNEAADAYERTHPLLELMPVEEDLFKIEYKGDGLYEYILKGVNRRQAAEAMLAWWRENNVSPDKLNLKEQEDK